MKKRLSKLLSGVIILTMVVASTGLAFATESGIDKTNVKSDSKVTESQRDSVAAICEKKVAQISNVKKTTLDLKNYDGTLKQRKAAASPTESSINATTLLYSTSQKADYVGGYLNAGYFAIIPVVAKNNGIMYMDASVSGGYGDFYLCESLDDIDLDAGEITYYDYAILSSGTKIGDSGMPVSKGKTYYIVIVNDTSDSTITAGIRAYVYTRGDRTLSQGTSKWTIASGINSAGNVSTTYFKIKPDRTGLMTVSLSEFESGYTSSGYVTLYSSQKKPLSNRVYYSSSSSDNRVYFGAKKGTSYYLKVASCYGNSAQNKFGIRYSMKSVTDRALSYKSKAKKLGRKASATSTLFAASTSTSADWYKIYVSSKRKTVIGINTVGIKSGNVSVTVYRGSKKVGSSTIYPYEKSNNFQITYGTTYGKANSGTYYIKVVKGTRTSGKYTIRYVQ